MRYSKDTGMLSEVVHAGSWSRAIMTVPPVREVGVDLEVERVAGFPLLLLLRCYRGKVNTSP